eukprot:8594227-Lingulodinium_polyedra.AAC.1
MAAGRVKPYPQTAPKCTRESHRGRHRGPSRGTLVTLIAGDTHDPHDTAHARARARSCACARTPQAHRT